MEDRLSDLDAYRPIGASEDTLSAELESRAAASSSAGAGSGFGRFVKVDGDVRIDVDEDKIKEAARWDVLKDASANVCPT